MTRPGKSRERWKAEDFRHHWPSTCLFLFLPPHLNLQIENGRGLSIQLSDSVNGAFLSGQEICLLIADSLVDGTLCVFGECTNNTKV